MKIWDNQGNFLAHFLVGKTLSLHETPVNTCRCSSTLKSRNVNLMTADTLIFYYNWSTVWNECIVTISPCDWIHKLSAGSLNCEKEVSVDAPLSSSNWYLFWCAFFWKICEKNWENDRFAEAKRSIVNWSYPLTQRTWKTMTLKKEIRTKANNTSNP